MTSSIQDKIAQAEALLSKREYKEATALLEKITARKGLSAEDRLACTLLKSRVKMGLAEYKDALALTEKALQAAIEGKDYLRAVESLSTKAEIAWRLGEFDMGLKAVEDGEKLLKGIKFEQAGEKGRKLRRRTADLLSNAGIIHWYRGALDRAIEYHESSLEILKKLDDLQGISKLYNNLGLVYWAKGELERAIEVYLRSLVISEDIGDKRNMSSCLLNIGNVYSMKGKLDEALEVYKRSLAIKEELNLKQELASSLVNIGSIYQLKGELDTALDYYQKGLRIGEELGDKTNIALATLNMGDIHMLRGDLDRAMEHFQNSLELYQELGVKQMVALSLSNMGEVYWKKGFVEQALGYYQQSLTIHEEMESAPYAATVLLNLLWIALEKDDSSLAERYLKKLERINEYAENKLINQRYRVAKALWFKSSKRARHKLEAEKILDEVINEEVGDYMLKVTAMIHLCDLLLSELKDTGEEELFGEIMELTDRLLEISKKQSSPPLLAQTYLLQSKLALIELDIGRAKKLLEKASSIAEEKGLNLLVRLAAQERDSLLSHVKKWESIAQQKPSRQEMIDETHINVLLERMIQNTVASVMEEKGTAGEKIETKRYMLVYVDRLKDAGKVEKTKFRVGVAQIGLSKAGDIIKEFYEEQTHGLFRFKEECVDTVRSKIKEMVEAASAREVELLIFPELTIDLSYPQIFEDVVSLAKTYKMFLIPGSYHDIKTKRNVSVVFSPRGILWEQEKHIPAVIHFKGTRHTEGIAGHAAPHKSIICRTEYGRIAIVICRDFLDMDLRVTLKNAEPPVDLVINPAFTPVTADFKSAHFDARRSIYAYCFFANVAEFGDSFIYTPEKESVERNLFAGEENLIYKEVDLFRLRSERKKWEIARAKQKPFIQSTR